MQIKERKAGGVNILDLSGEININTSPVVRKAFERLVNEKSNKTLLNFSQVNYIDSSGLATLVEMLQRLRRFGGQLRLACVGDRVKGLFEITKLERLFSIYASEEEALRDF